MRRLKRSRYITGFDGIRTLAVIAVIFYHLFPYAMQGGLMGVSIFFVISGYLITDLLLQEWEQNRKIDVKAFYIRRMKRLYPGLITMLVGTIAYITLFQKELLAHIRMVFLTNLTSIYNWYQIHTGQSYFDKFAIQSPFTHLWSLSIEGQFYLFWPLLIILMCKYLPKKSVRFFLLIGLSLLSALEMILLFKVGSDPSRVYYGTDTRVFSILIGAALAIVWPSSKLSQKLPDESRRLLNITGIVCALLVILSFFKMNGEKAFVYHGGMYLFSIISAILVATVAHPGANMNTWFTNPVFTWIGKRSYGIYIYQYPVMVFFESKVKNIAAHPWLYGLIEIAIILAISELSYRYIEIPLKNFDYSQTLIKVKQVFKRDKSHLNSKIGVAVGAIIFLIAGAGLVQQPTKKPQDNALAKQIKENNDKVKKRNSELKSSKKQSTEQVSSSSSSEVKKYQLTAAQADRARNMKITAVGDSVLADGASSLQEIFPNMYIDAKVGRQSAEAAKIVQQLAQTGKLEQTVLISEGTNGAFMGHEIQDIMNAAGKDRQVYWINVHVPTRRWQDQVNQDLASASKKYKNLHIIDWFSYSQNHADWFYNDNVHPNPHGLEYYGSFVAKKIVK